jgi:hypothetical protein
VLPLFAAGPVMAAALAGYGAFSDTAWLTTISSAGGMVRVNNLFAKTGLKDRVQAVRYAYQHGLVTFPGQATT